MMKRGLENPPNPLSLLEVILIQETEKPSGLGICLHIHKQIISGLPHLEGQLGLPPTLPLQHEIIPTGLLEQGMEFVNLLVPRY